MWQPSKSSLYIKEQMEYGMQNCLKQSLTILVRQVLLGLYGTLLFGGKWFLIILLEVEI